MPAMADKAIVTGTKCIIQTTKKTSQVQLLYLLFMHGAREQGKLMFRVTMSNQSCKFTITGVETQHPTLRMVISLLMTAGELC